MLWQMYVGYKRKCNKLYQHIEEVIILCSEWLNMKIKYYDKLYSFRCPSLSSVTLWDIKENEKNSKFSYCATYNGHHILLHVLMLLTLPKKLLLVTSRTFAIKLLSISFFLPFHFHPYFLLCSQNRVFTHTNTCRIMFLWIVFLCCFLMYQLTSLSPDLLVICLSKTQ
jgi:hypothetical protein